MAWRNKNSNINRNNIENNETASKIIRQQNDDLAYDLEESVGLLKKGVESLRNTIKDDRKRLNDIQDDSLKSNNLINDVMNGFDKMIGTGNTKMTCYLACFMVIIFILIYYLFMKKK
mmetsp:Transcript_86046/g.105571  ORF Transcript_86046/g.105571 Transcript_86046/m.105571 type:complete len:117 (+) Transcript_86046:56-406(+)